MKTVTTITASLMAVCAMAAEKADTTFTYQGKEITLSQEGDELTVDVRDTEGNELKNTYSLRTSNGKSEETWNVKEQWEFPFGFSAHWNGKKELEGRSRINSHTKQFYFGFNTVPGSDIDANMGRSMTFGFVFAEKSWNLGDGLLSSIGLGFDWKNVKMTDDVWMRRDGKETVLETLPEGVSLTYSRLRTFGFRIPFAIEKQLGNRYESFYVQAAVIAEITPMARVKNVYHDAEGNKHSENQKGLHHRVLGASVRGAVGYDDFGLFVEYKPTGVFGSSEGPDVKVLTVGLALTW